MSERARALEQALRMLIDAAVQTACKIAEDGDRRWHVVDLVCATNDAEKVLAVVPPPSGASPQAETSEDMGDGWYVTVGRWGESLVTIEQRCLSGKADLTDDDAALIRGAAQHLQAFIGQPAPVSPVEPTTCPKCRSNTRAYRLAVADVIDGRMAGMTSCRDEWHSRMPMVSPVEPEPLQRPKLASCQRCSNTVVVGSRCNNCDEPTVEPEPCVWRADWREGRDGSILVPSCQPEMEIDAAFVQECVQLHGWKFCVHCGAPLKVER